MCYRLHYAPDNASAVVRLVLEELGLAYEAVLVDRRVREQESAAFRALNPAGQIPVLETPSGPVSETAAVVLWLADRHGAMAPAPDDPDRPGFLKWLFFTSNTAHARLRLLFYPEAYVGPDPARQDALRGQARIGFGRDAGLLDDTARRRPGLFGCGTPSVLGYYVVCCLRWVRLYDVGRAAGFDIRSYPALHDLARRLEARPAALAVARAEGLGTTPFSAPMPCNPPEGSPT